jgi:hypothetical protein
MSGISITENGFPTQVVLYSYGRCDRKIYNFIPPKTFSSNSVSYSPRNSFKFGKHSNLFFSIPLAYIVSYTGKKKSCP